MAESFSEFIDKLLARTNIVSVISRYIPLKQKGNRWWGCCPFHHEKEPSFTVSEDKQFYYCFGCQETGNAITFVEKMESIDRIDAIKRLAQDANMEMPEYRGEQKKDGISPEKKERLYALMRDTARHYHENLSSDGAKNANDYISARKIPSNLVKRFGLGVSLNRNEIINYLEKKGYTKAEMKEVGLIEQYADSYYDVFYGRFIVPIIDNFGQVVAFGGRLITPETHIQQKYRNSTNTVLFDKSKTLYGINLLKKKKQSGSPINYVIIVEGYMDVIALHKAGFDTAVASMGTALTYAQAKAIRNYSSVIYVCFDGDSAGQKATMRGLDILRSAGLMVKVVSLPDELDPDDLIKRDGPSAYQKALDEAVGLIEYKLGLIKKEYEKATADGKFDPEIKAKYATQAIKVIASIDNPIEREEYLNMVHKDMGYPIEVLRGAIERGEETVSVAPTPTEKEREKPVRSKAETFILACLINGKSFVKTSDDIIPLLQNEKDILIAKYSLDKIKIGEKPVIGALMETFDAEYVREIADYDFSFASEQSIEQSYRDYLSRLKIKALEDEKNRLTELFVSTKDTKLLGQINQLSAKIRSIKNGYSEQD